LLCFSTARSRNLVSQAIGSVGSNSQEAAQRVLPDLLAVLKKMDRETIQAENDTVVSFPF